VALLDIDGLRMVNDQLGHQTGDSVLKEVARVLLSQLRPTDFVCRYGGDEFVCIFQAGPEETSETVRRIQLAFERSSSGSQGLKPAFGLSGGWASYGVDGNSLDELLVTADRAMHADKAKRRSSQGDFIGVVTGDLKRLNTT
jgi:diguanylate cyclase (GGDEF)-like protein